MLKTSSQILKPSSRVEAQSDGWELCVVGISPYPVGLGFFFPGSLEVFFFNFVPSEIFSPPSSLSFLLIRLCWETVSIEKQKSSEMGFSKCCCVPGLGEGRGVGESLKEI